jgi:hypothetical protein
MKPRPQVIDTALPEIDCIGQAARIERGLESADC